MFGILEPQISEPYNKDKDAIKMAMISSGFSFTKMGVRSFQSKYNLPATGVIDITTAFYILNPNERR